VSFVTPQINLQHLTGGEPRYLWAAVPVVILSFTSHIILPSLRQYLGKQVTQLKRVLLLGSLLPLLFYIIWELLVVGVFPLKGNPSLMSIATNGDAVANLTEAFSPHLNILGVGGMIGGFAFCSLVTSFLGATLSLFDFLADGLHINKHQPKGRLILLALSFIPPLLFGYFFPGGFVLALSYAGVFVAVLFGILPVLMVWKARYIEQQSSEFRLFGGKFLLIGTFLLSLIVIGLQIAQTTHYLPQIS
jgi:tyrosine-specific transport protein